MTVADRIITIRLPSATRLTIVDWAEEEVRTHGYGTVTIQEMTHHRVRGQLSQMIRNAEEAAEIIVAQRATANAAGGDALFQPPRAKPVLAQLAMMDSFDGELVPEDVFNAYTKRRAADAIRLSIASRTVGQGRKKIEQAEARIQQLITALGLE